MKREENSVVGEFADSVVTAPQGKVISGYPKDYLASSSPDMGII
ncbi:hypothetical protein [Proteiniphilum sp. UBA5384]|nr:hypothetical protein [Proteiniphilum sp. UBA5384]